MSKPLVGIVMGSDSDWPLVQKAADTLKSFGVAFEARVISAHRTPDLAFEYAGGAEARGLKALIAAAGGAAHLAGVMAAHTILPVIGIPIKGGAMDGLDSLLSTVQMPAGIPVATVALGRSGAVNAGLLAVQMLALERPDLQKKLAQHKLNLKKKVEEGNRRIAAQQEKKS